MHIRSTQGVQLKLQHPAPFSVERNISVADCIMLVIQSKLLKLTRASNAGGV